MNPPPFLIVADRGHMKAYRIQKARGRGPSAVLVEQFELDDVRQRYDERFSDHAGAFPSGGAPRVANATAERLPLEKETKARISRRLAGQIAECLRHYRPLAWGFAAASEINSTILGHLPSELQKSLACNLKHDLVKIPVQDLLRRVQDDGAIVK